MNTNVTHDTYRSQRESYAIRPEMRKTMILDKLQDNKDGMTARELSRALGFYERNAVAPRLTELAKENKVITVGKKVDSLTGRLVSVWALADEVDEKE